MEQDLHSPELYDYRLHDHIWKRVAPELEPYPDLRTPPVPAPAGLPAPQAPEPQPPAPAAAPQVPETQLPGASADPCCMGSAAGEMLNVLTGFIEEELEDRRCFQAVARQAPSWARQRLRDLAADAGAHARRLMAVYYLITGSCYRPAVSCGHVCFGNWCATLREQYHAEACNGLNYARAADGTTDPCLSRLLQELSADEYRHADQLMELLERSLQG